jgi:hypothetical protein
MRIGFNFGPFFVSTSTGKRKIKRITGNPFLDMLVMLGSLILIPFIPFILLASFIAKRKLKNKKQKQL